MTTGEVKIGDQAVKFAASAGTLRRYRNLFGGDLLMEMRGIDKTNLNTDVLEKLAYVMAKQADPDIPEDIDSWLDRFDMVAFMNALPEILNVWVKNDMTISTSKKK